MYLMNEDSLRTITTTEFYNTRAVKKAQVPKRYIIPDSLTEVLTLPGYRHCVLERIGQQRSVTVQRFSIRENKQGEREFQHKHENARRFI